MEKTIEKLQSINGYEAKENETIPVLPLRGHVLFPNSVGHLELGRSICTAAVNAAMKGNRMMFLTAMKDPFQKDNDETNLYQVGTIAKIVQLVKQDDQAIKVVIEGVARAVSYDTVIKKGGKYIETTPIVYTPVKRDNTVEEIARMRLIKVLFADLTALNPKLPPDIAFRVKMENSPQTLTDYVAANIISDIEAKQELLEEFDMIARLDKLIAMLKNDMEVGRLQKIILEKTNQRMDESQKEYFLHEQIRAIYEELGEEDTEEEAERFQETIDAMDASDEVKETLRKECSRLKRLPDSSQEAFTMRTYIETCLDMPWGVSSKDKIDIKSVERSLDKNHYGLKEVKERIIEYLAVRKLSPDVKGQILCLTGPPGVGKTSIAQSVGAAINRKVERVALGGVHDEAEIRGHRRTYIAAMPGRIVSALISAGTDNPLIILDEIDKLASDYKGDPTSALLEVLDPEQNNTFRDHYIDLPFDLSKVMFITTANDIGEIPAPLADRMEIIEIGSYTREEKFHIAKKHLIPKQIENCGLESVKCKFSSSAIYAIIDDYTREAGVRTLERKIAAVLRKVAKSVAADHDSDKTYKIDSKNIEEYLGPKKYKDEDLPETNTVGLVTGLAWTSVGGVTLPIETAVIPGTGKTVITGSLGDVMKESAQIAVTCVRSRAEALGISPDFYEKNDIHIHALEGAVPKDGPSAGVTMTTSIVSALTNKPVNKYVAMTGEISLRGRVLPIGGLKEKAMGAYKAGSRIMIIPKKNESDIVDIDETVREQLNIIPVETIDEVFEIAFTLDNTYEKPQVKKASRKRKSAKNSSAVSDLQARR